MRGCRREKNYGEERKKNVEQRSRKRNRKGAY